MKYKSDINYVARLLVILNKLGVVPVNECITILREIAHRETMKTMDRYGQDD